MAPSKSSSYIHAAIDPKAAKALVKLLTSKNYDLVNLTKLGYATNPHATQNACLAQGLLLSYKDQVMPEDERFAVARLSAVFAAEAFARIDNPSLTKDQADILATWLENTGNSEAWRIILINFESTYEARQSPEQVAIIRQSYLRLWSALLKSQSLQEGLKGAMSTLMTLGLKDFLTFVLNHQTQHAKGLSCLKTFQVFLDINWFKGAENFVTNKPANHWTSLAPEHCAKLLAHPDKSVRLLVVTHILPHLKTKPIKARLTTR